MYNSEDRSVRIKAHSQTRAAGRLAQDLFPGNAACAVSEARGQEPAGALPAHLAVAGSGRHSSRARERAQPIRPFLEKQFARAGARGLRQPVAEPDLLQDRHPGAKLREDSSLAPPSTGRACQDDRDGGGTTKVHFSGCSGGGETSRSFCGVISTKVCRITRIRGADSWYCWLSSRSVSTSSPSPPDSAAGPARRAAAASFT